jgi:hypothetical protein
MVAPKRGRREIRAAVLILVVGATVLGLAVCEVVLRRLGLGENVRTTATLGVYAPDPELRWTLKPGLDVNRDWVGRVIRIRTDADGHRVPSAMQATRGPQLIAFAGDSYVFGNEVEAEETFVHLVGEATRARSVNLGVGAYGLAQEALALRRYLRAHPRTARAFLVLYVGNDLEHGPYPPRFASVDEDGHIRYRPMSRWSRLRSTAVQHSRVAFYAHALWRSVVGPGTAAYAFQKTRAERADSTAAATAAPPAGSGSRWIYDEAAFTPSRLDEHRRVLSALRYDARQRGVPVTVVLMPEREQVYGERSDLPQQMLTAMLADLELPVLDLLPVMVEASSRRRPLWHDVVEGHLSPEGHRVVAAAILGR